jgi:hypothetical protein
MQGMAAEPGGSARAAVLGPFLAGFWQLPVPPQGPAPAGFAEAEASLDPAVCGACHAVQHREWGTSLHAGAWSPGFAGQLLEGALSAPAALRECQTCHAPLAEQQPVLASGEPQPGFDAALRRQGIVCAACHVRAHRRFGPPRRPELPPMAEVLPHAGFEARAEFTEARFCATCHQFFETAGPAGKPVQNTFAEWQASSHAAQGRTCQSCHMPDRAHTWRGIHDAPTVRAAIAVELTEVGEEDGFLRAVLSVANHGVGHAFPTYVTPRVFAAVWQVDAAGAELAGTRSEGVIGRDIDFAASPPRERFDTRVMPGRSFALDYRHARDPRAAAVRARVTVDPGHHYRSVYRGLHGNLAHPEARALVREALRRTEAVAYVLAEAERAVPPRRPPPAGRRSRPGSGPAGRA